MRFLVISLVFLVMGCSSPPRQKLELLNKRDLPLWVKEDTYEKEQSLTYRWDQEKAPEGNLSKNPIWRAKEIVHRIRKLMGPALTRRSDVACYNEGSTVVFRHAPELARKVEKIVKNMTAKSARRLDVHFYIYEMRPYDFRHIEDYHFEPGLIYGIYDRQYLKKWLSQREDTERIYSTKGEVKYGELFHEVPKKLLYPAGWKEAEDKKIRLYTAATHKGPEIELFPVIMPEEKGNLAVYFRFSLRNVLRDVFFEITKGEEDYTIRLPKLPSIEFEEVFLFPDKDASLLMALAWQKDTILLLRLDLDWTGEPR